MVEELTKEENGPSLEGTGKCAEYEGLRIASFFGVVRVEKIETYLTRAGKSSSSIDNRIYASKAN
jgi:hypothetical protein